MLVPTWNVHESGVIDRVVLGVVMALLLILEEEVVSETNAKL